MKRPEDAIQRQVTAYLDVALPESAVWFAVPNGGKRSKIEAAIMKGLGVKAGVPDLCIIWDCRVFFIELKAPGRYMTKAQQETVGRLQYAGALCCVCRSLDEVIEWLDAAGIPMRARAA